MVNEGHVHETGQNRPDDGGGGPHRGWMRIFCPALRLRGTPAVSGHCAREKLSHIHSPFLHVLESDLHAKQLRDELNGFLTVFQRLQRGLTASVPCMCISICFEEKAGSDRSKNAAA